MTPKTYFKAKAAALLLGYTRFAFAQHINKDRQDMWPFQSTGSTSSSSSSYTRGDACYNIRSVPGGPTTAQMLAMFLDTFVELNGKVYAVHNKNPDIFDKYDYGLPYHYRHKGLYEVTDKQGSPNCIEIKLLREDDGISQIVATSKFSPIEVIGLGDPANYDPNHPNKKAIYGYYPDPSSTSGSPWQRKDTGWGSALDGSLVTEQVQPGNPAEVVGICPVTGHMFHLWGSSADEFNYALDDGIDCDIPDAPGKPTAHVAIMGSWKGFHAGSRGFYCIGKDNNQLRKWTWHSSHIDADELIWEPALKIATFSPGGNMYGISKKNGHMLTLWNNSGTIYSCPLHIDSLKNVQAVGGYNDMFAIDGNDYLYHVFWDGIWQAKKMSIDYIPPNEATLPLTIGTLSYFFGNHNGKTYLLYGWQNPLDYNGGVYTLYRMDFVGSPDRFHATPIKSF